MSLPVDGDCHEREDGDRDGEVRDEVVDGAVERPEDPVPVGDIKEGLLYLYLHFYWSEKLPRLSQEKYISGSTLHIISYHGILYIPNQYR